jgi:hypothetical protein
VKDCSPFASLSTDEKFPNRTHGWPRTSKYTELHVTFMFNLLTMRHQTLFPPERNQDPQSIVAVRSFWPCHNRDSNQSSEQVLIREPEQEFLCQRSLADIDFWGCFADPEDRKLYLEWLNSVSFHCVAWSHVAPVNHLQPAPMLPGSEQAA